MLCSLRIERVLRAKREESFYAKSHFMRRVILCEEPFRARAAGGGAAKQKRLYKPGRHQNPKHNPTSSMATLSNTAKTNSANTNNQKKRKAEPFYGYSVYDSDESYDEFAAYRSEPEDAEEEHEQQEEHMEQEEQEEQPEHTKNTKTGKTPRTFRAFKTVKATKNKDAKDKKMQPHEVQEAAEAFQGYAAYEDSDDEHDAILTQYYKEKEEYEAYCKAKEDAKSQLPPGALPAVMSYELDLPTGKKARSEFDKSVESMVRRIQGSWRR